jgi:hypothetical protein
MTAHAFKQDLEPYITRYLLFQNTVNFIIEVQINDMTGELSIEHNDAHEYASIDAWIKGARLKESFGGHIPVEIPVECFWSLFL